MPYPFAHPAAVLPLAPLMGRFAVPSALAIGSIAPDLWYLVPLVQRLESHSLAGLPWFCLPAGLIVLIALISPRLGWFTPAALPAAPLRAVAVSLLAGALTHLAWDGLTHAADEAIDGHNWLQHLSTAAGTLVLAVWSLRKLRQAPPAPAVLSPLARTFTLLALLGSAALAAAWMTDALVLEPAALRRFLRAGGVAAVYGFGAALLVYCLLFQRKMLRRAA
jgi:hypothetical protein